MNTIFIIVFVEKKVYNYIMIKETGRKLCVASDCNKYAVSRGFENQKQTRSYSKWCTFHHRNSIIGVSEKIGHSPSNHSKKIRKIILKNCLVCKKEFKVTTLSTKLYCGKKKDENGCYRKQRLFLIHTNPELRYTKYRQNASNRNLQFDLNYNDFLILVKSNCYYCGYEPREGMVGLDRVNSMKGYLLDNLVPACKNCNFAKQSLTRNEFIGLVKKIARRFP